MVHSQNTMESYLNSKKSETSHEVWNAQSSHQNGIQTPCSTYPRSAMYSNTNPSPKHEEQACDQLIVHTVESNSNTNCKVRPAVLFDTIKSSLRLDSGTKMVTSFHR